MPGTPKPLTFGLQSKPGEWGAEGQNRLINAYAEDMGEEGVTRFPIKPSPGLKLFGQPADARPCRGMIPVAGRLYPVIGQALFSVDSTGTFGQALGGVAGEAPVFMAANQRKVNAAGNQIDAEVAIVSDGNRYLLEASAVNPSLSPITDPDLPPPIAVIYVDGYFLYAIADGRVFVSGLNDGASVDPLAFFTAEGAPDGLVSMGVRQREVFLFGETTTEVWANDGSNEAAPFSRSLGEFIEHGCAARSSVAEFMETLAWVDNKNRVVRADGYTTTVISNPAVQKAIEDLSPEDKSAITSLTHTVAGYRFLQLSSPKWTWEFNGDTGLWNERESYQSPRYRGAVSAVFAGKTLIGDRTNGNLYEQSRKIYDEAGQALIWTVRAPTQHNYPFNLKVSTFYARLIPGVGLNNPDPALKDPRVMMRYSDDSGHSWSNTRQLALGKIGEKAVRVKANRLGKTKEAGRIWELSVSAAVARGLVNAAATVDQRAA